jgi:hypothetical protein
MRHTGQSPRRPLLGPDAEDGWSFCALQGLQQGSRFRDTARLMRFIAVGPSTNPLRTYVLIVVRRSLRVIETLLDCLQ